MSKNLTLIVTVVLSLVLACNVSAALVGKWNFDDGTANDSSGAPTIHNGTLQGGALVVTDPTRGQVLSCDGVDDMVKCVGYKAILGANPRSISAWIKTSKTGSSIQGIVAWGKNTSNLSWDFVVTNSKLSQMIYNKSRGSSITVADGNWHHVASVYGGGNLNTVKFYVDGILDTSTSGDGSTAINTTSGPRDFMIGNTDSLGSRFFQGMIDDVRLFDTALTDGDIRLLANKLEAYNFSPANGALVVSSAVLDWDTVAPSPTYNVYLSSSQADVTSRAAGACVGSNQVDSSYSASGLALDTTFYWVVDVVSGGNTYAGPVMTFTTAKPYAYNPLPISGAKFMPRTISLLSWTRSNIMQTQDVYFGTNPEEMELVVDNYTEPNMPISELEAGLTYYWRVDTHSAAGVNSLGTWSFQMASSIPDESLVAWWPMDSDDSSYIWDHSGHGHHALKNGTPSIITDIQRGNVMNFPGGIGNYFNAGGKGDWASFTNTMTYCAWFKVNAFDKNMQCLIGTSGQYRLGRNGTTNKMRLWHDPSPPRGTLGGTSDVNDNKWHHGCGVVDGDGTNMNVYLYVDGELESSASYTGSLLAQSSSDLFIGSDSTSYTDREWKGQADDVRIYNRALSQIEIKRLIGKLGATNFIPANGNNTLTTSVQLDWESIAENPTYNVYFSSNFDDVNNHVSGALVGNGITESTYLASDLNTDTTYYWAVDVIDNGTTYPCDRILSFTTPRPYAFNPTPIEGGTYPASTTKLSWTASPISSGQDVYLGTDPGQMELIAENTTDPNVTVELAAGLTYYWRVDTTSSLGVQSQGVWSFTTISQDEFSDDPSLVGWWKFDADAGATAWDYSGNNYHGTIVNATHAGGKQGQGINLVRANSCRVTIPAAAFSTVNSQVTVALWAFGGNALPAQTSVFNGDEGTGNRILNAHLPWDSGAIIFDAGAAGSAYDRFSKAATANQYKGQWNHWAFTKNTATGNMKMYLNGMLWATLSGKTKPMSGITRFKIGCGANGSSNFYDGIVDDFRVYNRELSDQEILEISGNASAHNFSPANNAVTMPDILLDWASLKDGLEGVTYDVYLSSNFEDVNTISSTRTPVATDLTVSQFQANSLALNTTYYWAVDVNDNGTMYMSPAIMSFATASSTASNPVPANGTQLIAVTQLSWTSTIAMTNQKVYFGTDSALVTAHDASTLLYTGTETTVPVSNVVSGNTYYWTVVTTTSVGDDSLGVWSFTGATMVDPNLVGWWKMDSQTGAWDYSGYAHHGSFVADANIIDDGGEFALSLNGVDEYVNIAGYKGILDGKARTTCAWVKTTSDGAVITWGKDAAGQKWHMKVDPTSGVRTGISGGYVLGGTDVNDGQWHHVAAVIANDGSPTADEIVMYIDGQLEAHTNVPVAQAMNTVTDKNVAIGTWMPEFDYFKGRMKDVRMYDKALSQAEIWTIVGIDPVLDGLQNVVDNWLTTGPAGDLNADGIIDLRDFNLAAEGWGWQN